MKRFFLMAWLALAATAAHAQMPVYFQASVNSSDLVGSRLEFAFKEKIRRSAGMQLVTKEEPGTISLYLVTLDPDAKTSTSGHRTIYSAVWVLKTFHKEPVTSFIASSVGTCGGNRVQECAEDFAAKADKETSEIRALLDGMMKNK